MDWALAEGRTPKRSRERGREGEGGGGVEKRYCTYLEEGSLETMVDWALAEGKTPKRSREREGGRYIYIEREKGWRREIVPT